MFRVTLPLYGGLPEKRGLALGLTSSGASFGTFLFPPLAAALIAAYGWRNAYLILGLIGLIVIGLCAAFTVRDPEQMGLHADGQIPAATVTLLIDVTNGCAEQ